MINKISLCLIIPSSHPGFDLNQALGDLIKYNFTSNQWESRSYSYSPVSDKQTLTVFATANSDKITHIVLAIEPFVSLCCQSRYPNHSPTTASYDKFTDNMPDKVKNIGRYRNLITNAICL